MPVDYRRLVEGLGTAASPSADSPELVKIETMVATVGQETAAVGASFTEYCDQGGRIIVAHGAVSWALGQPVPPQLLASEVSNVPFGGWVADAVPAEFVEQLHSRGIVALAGHPVRHGGRIVGAVHLFFAEFVEQDLTQVEQVLRLTAACIEHIYTGSDLPPVRSSDEEDDRSLFLALAGHELRTPVTVIKGYASLVAGRWEALSESERRSAVKVLTQRADELAALVDRLLGVWAGDVRSGAVRQVPFDPVEALARAADELPAELRHALRVELPSQLPPASGDPAVLGTVLTELVTNAVKAGLPAVPSGDADGPAEDVLGLATSPEQASVDLTAGADGDTVFIRVCDRGSGIDPAHAERAFERFWRGGGDADGHGGVGLGLYLVRRLVERQNGWVSLRPRDGGGTVAEIRLARADGPSRVLSGSLLPGDTASREA